MDTGSGTLRALEWDKLVFHLAAECQAPTSRQQILSLPLPTERLTIERLLAETAEAASLLANHSLSFLDQLRDLASILKRARAQATLSTEELKAVRITLLLSKLAKGSLSHLPSESFKCLPEYASRLSLVANVHQAIDIVIDENGEIKDDASPHLKTLRKQTHDIDDKIKDELNHLIRSADLAKAIQEPLYTVRNSRYVLPVVASMRTLVPGIVHDSSASGLTVYVEPLAVVELSNTLRLKECEIEQEIMRILTEASKLIAAHSDEIEQSQTTLIELDKIFARARLGIKYNGSIPAIAEGSAFELLEARHPLLALTSPSGKVVGNDIVLDGLSGSSAAQGTTLVITGPNTGGKTVLLKTIGLLSLMLRAGLMLPVKHGSTARIFNGIYADIGDEQSLEQSLSTFSGHMINVVQILNSAGRTSLVLLDEVGAGTDPKEGAALAQAIMEYLNTLGCLTVVTTHLVELKTLAYERPGFINGSFEFDEATLLPTYKLRIGMAGRSQATTIAQRLGLKPSVVERTRQLLTSAEKNIQDSIEALEEAITEASEREGQAKILKDAVTSLKEEYEAKLASLNEEAKAIRQAYLDKIGKEFSEAKDSIREITAELQRQPGLAKAQAAQVKLERVRQDLGWLNVANDQPAEPQDLLKLGTRVLIQSLNQSGVIDQVPSESSVQGDPIVQVRVGQIKLRVPLSDLRPDSKQATTGRTATKSPVIAHGARSKMSLRAGGSKEHKSKAPETIGASVLVQTNDNTLDLRGLRVDEALSKLADFLNAAVFAGTSPLLVIHGHGTGALKSAVREELSGSDYAIEFRPGQRQEGGDGVTVIFLK